MPQFAQNLIVALSDVPTPRGIMDQLGAAADCLAKVSISNFTSGVYPEIDDEGVTPQEAKSIENALLAIYHAHTNASGIGTVIWALSKARNLALRPLFLRHTELAMDKLQSAYCELSQAVCGLDDLVFCGEDDSGYPEIPPNPVGGILAEAIDQADAYLRREGILIPIGGRPT